MYEELVRHGLPILNLSNDVLADYAHGAFVGMWNCAHTSQNVDPISNMVSEEECLLSFHAKISALQIYLISGRDPVIFSQKFSMVLESMRGRSLEIVSMECDTLLSILFSEEHVMSNNQSALDICYIESVFAYLRHLFINDITYNIYSVAQQYIEKLFSRLKNNVKKRVENGQAFKIAEDIVESLVQRTLKENRKQKENQEENSTEFDDLKLVSVF